MRTHARNNTDLLDLSLELADRAAAMQRTWLHNALKVGGIAGIDQVHAQAHKIIEEVNAVRAEVQRCTEETGEIFDALGMALATVKEILTAIDSILVDDSLYLEASFRKWNEGAPADPPPKELPFPRQWRR
jgi:hypothetical protein